MKRNLSYTQTHADRAIQLARQHRVFWSEELHIEVGPPGDALEVIAENQLPADRSRVVGV